MNRKLILIAMGASALAVAACTPAAEDKAETTDGAMAPATDSMAPADGAMAPADGAMAPAGTMTADEKMAADKMNMDKMNMDKMAADKMAPAQ